MSDAGKRIAVIPQSLSQKPEVAGKWHEKMALQDCLFLLEFPLWLLRATYYCCVLYTHHYACSHEGWPSV